MEFGEKLSDSGESLHLLVIVRISLERSCHTYLFIWRNYWSLSRFLCTEIEKAG